MTRPRFAALVFVLLGLVAMGVFLYRRTKQAYRDDVFTMRAVIDQYTLDKQREPRSLDDLVRSSYLRRTTPNERRLEELFHEASDKSVAN